MRERELKRNRMGSYGSVYSYSIRPPGNPGKTSRAVKTKLERGENARERAGAFPYNLRLILVARENPMSAREGERKGGGGMRVQGG